VNQDATDALLDLLNRVASAERDLIDGIDEAAAVAETVLEVHGAAVMLLNRDGDFGLVGASNPYAAALERAQIEAGDGPCMECTRRGAVVAVDDLTEAPRWQGLAGPHVRAVLAAPIWFLGRPVGSLNALCSHPRTWTAENEQSLAAYAGVVTALLRVAVAAGNDDDPLVAELRLSLDAQA